MTFQLTHDVAAVIIKPRVTEKAALLAEKNVYTFEVSQKANKRSVAAAIKALYKVTPLSVSVVNIRAKKVFLRGKAGVKKGSRKAYVTLSKKDKIEF